MIRLNESVCSNLELASRREWLETNGLGGYASSTACGMNTRRYHGLLVAATRPPVGRMVLLSKLEETLVCGDSRFDLSVNRYPGTVHPQGHQYLTEFRAEPFPTWVYRAGGIEITRSLFLRHGENTVVVEYAVTGGACKLEIRPLIACRDYHGMSHANPHIRRTYDEAGGVLALQPYDGAPELFLAHNGAAEAGGDWYYDFEYDIERQRGFQEREDLFNPLVLSFNCAAGRPARIIASTKRRKIDDADELRIAELKRRSRISGAAAPGDPFSALLHQAADQFIVERGSLKSIIAGYPWFSDWGRDTMISLPGITLATGREDVARDILLAYAQSASQGMLPNRFPDEGEEPEYNTVDATLWFFEAVRAYLQHTGDYSFVEREIYPVMISIIEWHLRGTRYGIRVDPDGLLRCGEPGVQLTWMDAKVGDWVVTPRYGKPVEIQALWYNALLVMAALAERFEGIVEAHAYEQMAARAKDAFLSQFWNEDAECLYDVVDGESHDGTIRPNQIFAVSLHFPLLAGERARQVVETVQRELLTPAGLRSLSPYDPRYRGRYEGDVLSRDGAYHQGTVWSWLLGPFIEAYLKVHGFSPEARRQAGDWLGEMRAHLWDAGLGQVSEIFDGDSPHNPRGCFAQAWSIAELLRVYTLLEEPGRKPQGNHSAEQNTQSALVRTA
jgi:predicted glycogen debranching enzyme